MNRRDFISGTVAGAALLPNCVSRLAAGEQAPIPYKGPNMIVVRFGGGIRRRESIEPGHAYSPYLCHELTKRGTLFSNMVISDDEGVQTSHGEGTLNILTGKYDVYEDIEDKFLGSRFEAKSPTLFEYLRKQYQVAEHETLIINGEDRTDEEFYTFSNHHLFGVRYRSTVLSLYRFKTFLLRNQIEEGAFVGKQLEEKRQELAQMEALDYRRDDQADQSPELSRFWRRWRAHYGSTGMVNPRGDSLLTELAVWAMRHLQPRLMMINYNDCDYVHWGNMAHYTRAIAIMDRDLQRLVRTVESEPAYRDNTVFAIVPDCGRDANPFIPVPCQHHFNTASSREIFSLWFGPGIDRGRRVERTVEQNMVAATVGQVMGFPTRYADGPVLEEAIA